MIKIMKKNSTNENNSPELLIVLILGIALGLFLISCEREIEVTILQEPSVLSKDTENYYQKVTEYTYEGCEYIKVGYGQSIWGSHKGNCKNPIHKK